MADLFRLLTTLTMNKTVIQYRNKTITHYHDHVHLHSPGDWASLWIAAIVMIGVIIAVTAVACLVSNKKVIFLCGADKYGVGGGGLKLMLDMKWQACTSWFFVLGAEASQPETDRWGRDPEHCFRDGEV